MANYWIYGKHAVASAIINTKRKHTLLLLAHSMRDFYNKYSSYISKYHINVVFLSNLEISRKIGNNLSHQGVALSTTKISQFSIEEFLKDVCDKSIVVILDQITDPQNIGSIIRSAVGFGADAVITTKNNAPSETPAMLKAAVGSFEKMPYIRVNNISRTIDLLKKFGYWVVMLSANANVDIREIKGYKKIAILLGAEGKGARLLSEKKSDISARINISKNLESLNVSNAAAISLYEISYNL